MKIDEKDRIRRDFYKALLEGAQLLQQNGTAPTWQSLIRQFFGMSCGLIDRIPDLTEVAVDDAVDDWADYQLLTQEERRYISIRRDSHHNLLRASFPDEEWKEIVNHPGYLVSNYGRFWNLNRRQGLMTPQAKTKRGHTNPEKQRLYVTFSDGNAVKKKELAHRLVAKAFVPNPYGYDQVDHLNENPQDNRAVNLEWVDAKTNVERYMINHGYWYKHAIPPANLYGKNA